MASSLSAEKVRGARMLAAIQDAGDAWTSLSAAVADAALVAPKDTTLAAVALRDAVYALGPKVMGGLGQDQSDSRTLHVKATRDKFLELAKRDIGLLPLEPSR
jgi:hypothetical protein